MADNYLLFSESLEDLTAEEAAWLEKQLQEIAVAGGEEIPLSRKPLAELEWHGPRFLRDLPEYDPNYDSLGFEWLMQDGEELWIYAEEYGTPEHAVHLVQKFLAKFRPDECWSLGWALTCSKPRIGEFGGGAVFVTAKGAEWFVGDSLVADRTRAFNESRRANAEVRSDKAEEEPEKPASRTIRTGVHGITVDLVGQCGTIASELRHVGDSPALIAAYDALEGVILAHACAGIDIMSPAYLEGVETAIQGVWNQYE